MDYTSILSLVGRDSFIKGRWYDPGYIEKIGCTKLASSFIHTYSVKSESSRRHYTVKIKNNGEDVLGYSCDCPQFDRAKTCKHVAAVLMSDGDDLASFEIIDELELSKKILADYQSDNKTNIKQKLEVELEFAFVYRYVNVKLRIGDKKKYTLSVPSKFRNFIYAYKNKDEDRKSTRLNSSHSV